MSLKLGERGARVAHVLSVRWAVLILALVLAASVIGLAVLYPRATRQLVAPHEQPLVERAQRAAAAAFGTNSEEITRSTFPIAIQLSDRTCLELRPTRRGDGGYLACYDNRTGRMVEEHVRGATFGE